ncbi:general secretion pathway protein GspB [Yersinia enterocolitica]|uniref:general secretion pathway protein GspB n=1 Tax=Yersinia enterocolitica TaxID=630 RepID=UPI0030B0679D|nr:general secretion pathway protein GspB [Yersinia enterocolitica]EKN6081439.1 hypothetical protein [Yersinia enterocolitica]EKN6153999.1 hypothetical protein [Yersinia enterocolitica]EKN6173522.1 hypothetical protein [Yersinia enterocolitica]
MSLLNAAEQKSKQPPHLYTSTSPRLSLHQGRRMLLLIWLLGLPVSAGLGMASRYLWHVAYNKPIERRVDVPHPTPLPYRLLDDNLVFNMQPLPDPASDIHEDYQPVIENEVADSEEGGPVPDELSERVMAAFAATKKNTSLPVRDIDLTRHEENSITRLPTAVRQRFSPMQYNTHVYSETAVARFINLNGQVYHEGDTIVQGLRLIRIEPHDSIFMYEGQNFSAKALTDW